MAGHFDLDGLLDLLAARLAGPVAERVAERLAGNGAAGIKPRLLTVEQAAVYLGRTKTAVQHLIHERRLPIVREGGRVFLDRIALDSWIESHTEAAEEGT